MVESRDQRPQNLTLRSTSMATIQAPESDHHLNERIITITSILACPVCHGLVICKGDPNLAVFHCNTCKEDYMNNDIYVDLTVGSGAKANSKSMFLATGIFRSSLMSFLYERGWRQTFRWGGFPGPEKEYEMARVYLRSTEGGTVVDASCGTGMFTRAFAKSGMYSLVVALDFSENMLRQCYEFIKEENIPTDCLALVRADISSLPFASNSIDAVHAGAALHCWPSAVAAVAEITRVLRPGGVFVATTYILDGAYFPDRITSIFRKTSGIYFFISEGELKNIYEACGLVGFTCVRNRCFVMISATKPT